MSQVTVTDIQQLSPTVKGFTLQVANTQLSFKPGQWVDLCIPSEAIVGGYSFTSAPHHLRERGTIDLAIQYSDHPPTLWMSTKCKVGDQLSVCVGGDFFYHPPVASSPLDLLLVAGGVGINPLFSMLQHHASLLQSAKGKEKRGGAVRLLYSAKSSDELIFKDQIDRMCEEHCDISVQYFVTQVKSSYSGISCRRLQAADVAGAILGLDPSRLQCFICGPPPMIEDVQTFLRDGGVTTECVHVEKWW